MTFQLGGYRATELLGRGGSAQVYLAVRDDGGPPVALKVFEADQLALARREASLAAAVDHPHVVRVLDVIVDQDRCALVTEYANGGDLADLLARRGRLSAGETLTVLLPLAAALATAHERHIVHGDLSAGNVLFDRAGRPLLADLGAGRAAFELGRPVAATAVDAAPELARGGSASPATDVFSLGSLALACLTGRHAWPADDLRDVLIQAAGGQWPDPGDDAGPPALVTLIRSMLEHDADRRPGAAAVVMDLRAAGRPEPVDLRLAKAPASAPVGGAVIIGAPAVSGARHLSPDEAGPVAPSASDEADSGRLARSRAITRVRADAPVRPDETTGDDPHRRWWQGLTRPTRPVRVGLLVVAAVLVMALAATGGLMWAGWDRSEPVAGRSADTRAASSTSPVPSTGPPSSISAPAGSTSGVAAIRTAGASTGPASSGPVPADRTVPTTTASTARLSPAHTAAASSTAGTDWAATIRALDDARAQALVKRDPELLDAVYTIDSPARRADAAVIASLLAGGWRVSGAEHRLRAAAVISAAPLRVRVEDSLPSYSVLDAAGRIVGQTPPRSAAARVMVLVRTPAGFRISDVHTA